MLYGCESPSLPTNCIHSFDTTQGNLIKMSLGLSRRCRSGNLFRALGVKRPSDVIKSNTASLLYRIMSVPSPAQDLCVYLLSLYSLSNTLIPGTLIHRIVSHNLSPTFCAFNRYRFNDVTENGVVDSLRNLLLHVNFIKPYSEQHILSSLLLRAF